MRFSRFGVPLVLVLTSPLLAFSPAAAQGAQVVVGPNVNMVSGGSFPNGDPFQRQQNEPSVAFSSRNSLHLLGGANDYRAVDVPGLPGGRETGDSWLSYFWSTNGGATWKSTLIPGYPQDPACAATNPDAPALCGYAAGADPVVRAGVNGMFYYSGIVFERGDPSRSAIFVSRFIDLNNDEGGDPIRYIDTVILDANDDGSVFLDKSWIGVDVPRAGSSTRIFPAIQQRGGAVVGQTVQCGKLYVGYAAIGGEGQDLRSEIRLATSADCGDTWSQQLISQPDSLNQGANIGIDPISGNVHVVWRRFDTVETFLGISAAGCPVDPASWEVSENWPTSSITVGGITYTREQALEILRTPHRGDESIKVAYVVIAAKLNLLTGGGDAANGFNATQWGQQLSSLVAQADAWLTDHPIGSDPKQDAKHAGLVIKQDMQEILLGSGTCSEQSGTAVGTTGETNAILVASSTDGGSSFGAPVVIDESSTFDQGSTTFSFRTTAYPTVTVDADGRVYAAWSARGFASIRGGVDDGDARIVVSSSTDGLLWSEPAAVDDNSTIPGGRGHQIKPSLLYAGGRLTLVYYDFRQDISNIFDRFVIDLPDPDRLRHTVDVRVATALPGAAPSFTDYSLMGPTGDQVPARPSEQASRYAFLAIGDDFSGETTQVEYMPPNLPMFADGTTPFIGDYVDVAAPNLLYEETGSGGTWRFATQPGDVQVWQAVWSDNRDVIPPPDGDWAKYVAPITQAQPSLFDPTVILPSCEDVTFLDAPAGLQAGSLYTGTRNQNVYSASISTGLIVAAPGNNRPLVLDSFGEPLERGFVVYVQNSTDEERVFELTLLPPAGIDASFDQSLAVLFKQVTIPPYSSAAETVFAALSATGGATTETIPVSVVEIGGTLAGTVLLNSDPEAPDPLTLPGEISLLDAEVHNPAIFNPAILNPAIFNASVDPSLCTDDPAICVLNPAIFNPAIFNPAIFNPAILNPAILNPAIFNPAIFNPAIFNPAIFNPAIFNPAILNPAIFNPAIFNPAIFNPAILNPAILNPAIMNPAILNPAILNPAILNPAILNPAILNPAILNPAILNATTSSDTRQVDVTFSVTNEGNATTAYDLNLDAPELAGLDYELMVYSLNSTPVADGCLLTTEAQQLLVFNQSDPTGNAVDGSFYLEPGQQVLVTFRVLPDPLSPTLADPVTAFDVADLTGQVTSQTANTGPVPQPPADQFGDSAAAVSLWRADGDALDSIGSNDGTLQSGAGFATGRVGQAFSLSSASSQHVLVADDPSLQITGALTMSAWIHPTGPGSHPTEGGIILNKEWAYEVARFADGTIRWATGNGVDSFAPLNAWVNSGVTAPLDTWTHVAVTYDQGVGTTYINGTQVHTFDVGVDNLGAGTAPLRIGGRGYQSQYFDGRIDEARIDDGALAPAAVLDLYNASPSFTITSFDPSLVFSGTSPAQEAALDAAVGVTGYVIEDFEDLTLVPGLTATDGAFGLNSQSTFANAVWDGTSYYVDQVLVGGGVNFSVAGGTSSFGIGLGDIDVAEVHLFVNDQDFGSIMALPNFVKLGDNVRDVYVRIDAAPGESITSVRIKQVSGAFSDGVFFDHLAFAPPAPVFTVYDVPGTAGGTTIGGGGTPPVDALALGLGEQVLVTATGLVDYGAGTVGPDGYGGTCAATCLVNGVSGIALVARIGSGPWQFVGAGPTVLTATTAGTLQFGVNDNLFNDNSGAFQAIVSPITATQFTETVITGDADILNDGLLVAANDFGASPSAVTVNGVSFGTDQGGLIGAWGPGAGDFSVDPFSGNLDALLSDLQFSGTLVPVSFTLGGLTPGTSYRLQLLFSNDLNTTGDRVEVTVDGATWILDDWQPDAINLTVELTATSSSVVTTFAPGVGSTGESGRAVLNGYVLHETTP